MRETRKGNGETREQLLQARKTSSETDGSKNDRLRRVFNGDEEAKRKN